MEAALGARSQLPEEFRRAKAVAAPSAKTGHVPGIVRVRLIFRLQEPFSSKAIQEFAKGFNRSVDWDVIDTSPLGAGSIIFTSRPLGRIPDAVPTSRWAFVLDGDHDEVYFRSDRFADLVRLQDLRVSNAVRTAPAGSGWRAILALVTGEAGGFFINLTRAAGEAVASGVSTEMFVAAALQLVKRLGDRERIARDERALAALDYELLSAAGRDPYRADRDDQGVTRPSKQHHQQGKGDMTGQTEQNGSDRNTGKGSDRNRGRGNGRKAPLRLVPGQEAAPVVAPETTRPVPQSRPRMQEERDPLCLTDPDNEDCFWLSDLSRIRDEERQAFTEENAGVAVRNLNVPELMAMAENLVPGHGRCRSSPASCVARSNSKSQNPKRKS